MNKLFTLFSGLAPAWWFIGLSVAWLACLIWVLVYLPFHIIWACFVVVSAVFVSSAWWLFYKQKKTLGHHIHVIGDTLKSRRPGKLNTVELDQLPSELRPLGASVNAFLEKEHSRLQHEHTFSSEASHQLRTPLAGIRLQAQIAQRVAEPEKREKALNNIIKAIDRNTHLVEQLLHYSRLTNYPGSSGAAEIDITKESKALLDRYTDEAEKAGNIRVEIDMQTELPQVECTPEHFSMLLKNLLNNAIHFTPPRGLVRFKVEPQEEAIVIKVEDSGPGIDQSLLSGSLSPFQTTSSGAKQSTGLGLAIVQRIVEIHNASLALGQAPIGGLSASIAFRRVKH